MDGPTLPSRLVLWIRGRWVSSACIEWNGDQLVLDDVPDFLRIGEWVIAGVEGRGQVCGVVSGIRGQGGSRTITLELREWLEAEPKLSPHDPTLDLPTLDEVPTLFDTTALRPLKRVPETRWQHVFSTLERTRARLSTSPPAPRPDPEPDRSPVERSTS